MDAPARGFVAAISLAAYAAGALLTTVAVAYLYGNSSAPRGSYLDGLLVAGAAGVLHYVVLRVSRCLRTAVAAAILAMTLLSFAGGHVIAYREAQDFAYDYVHRIAPEKFEGAEWRGLDRSANFRRYVGWVTGTPGAGAWAYVRLQTAIGTNESRMGRGGRQEWTLSGIFVWIAWLAQLVMIFLGYAAALGAALPERAPPG